jgi:hypothetical protein
MRPSLAAAVAVAVAALARLSSSLPPPPPPPGWGPLTFLDEFSDSALNTSLWAAEDTVWRGGIYEPSNVAVDAGRLVLSTIAKNQSRAGQDYYVSSGAVTWASNITQRFGRFEVRAQLPDVNMTHGFHLHSSIWLVNVTEWTGCGNSSTGKPLMKVPEIDVIEYDPTYGGATDPAGPGGAGHFHSFFDENCTEAWTPNDSWGRWLWNGTQAQALSESFHTFGLSWTPQAMLMDVDGATVFNVTASAGEEHARFIAGISNDPLYLLLTSCVMLQRPLEVGVDVLPQFYQIDWVRAFAYDGPGA